MGNYTDPNLIAPEDLFQTPIPSGMPVGTRVNSREAYPGVIRPLDLTVVSIPNDHGIRRGLRDLGIGDNDPPAMMVNRVHLGRFYVNLSWVMWQADILPFTDAKDWEAQLFGTTGSFEIERPAITRRQKLRCWLFFPRLVVHMVRAVLGKQTRLHANLAVRAAFDPKALDTLALDQLIERFQDDLVTACGWLTRGSFVPVFLVSFLSRLCGPERMPQVIAALSDLGEVESAAPALRIRELARQLSARHPNAAASLAAASDRQGWLRANAPDVAADIDRLLERYGYRSVGEFVISGPSWAEDPQPVFDALAGLLAGDGDAEEQQPGRAQAVAALLEGQGPVKRFVTRLLVRGAHMGARTREEAKANLIIRVDMLRQLFREMGVRLAADGVLATATDIQFLTLDEVRRGLRGQSSAGLAGVADQRRGEVARLDNLPEPPELITGSERVNLSEIESVEAGSVLRGQGVSGGIVEGAARVIETTSALDDFVPGEILVAAFTDAGWTPYFTLASGVIVETGGLLTHTSVVARELGLPAVVGVRDATSLLRTGDRLRIDPAVGTVELLSRLS